MYDELTTIGPPLYLVSSMSGCWRCGAEMPVVAILAPNVPGTEGAVCILSDIQELPQSILNFIFPAEIL